MIVARISIWPGVKTLKGSTINTGQTKIDFKPKWHRNKKKILEFFRVGRISLIEGTNRS